MLAKDKLNSIETLMSQALIDLDISHEEFKTIVNEKEKYEQMKESIRTIKNRDESRDNSWNIRENNDLNNELNIFLFCAYKMVYQQKNMEKMV